MIQLDCRDGVPETWEFSWVPHSWHITEVFLCPLWPDTHSNQLSSCHRTPWTSSGATGLNGEGNAYCGFWLVTCWYHKCPGSWWRRYVGIFFTIGSFYGLVTVDMGSFAVRPLRGVNLILWCEFWGWGLVVLIFGDFSLQPLKASALLEAIKQPCLTCTHKKGAVVPL